MAASSNVDINYSESELVKVYVGNRLPNHIHASHIREHFKDYESHIHSVIVPFDRKTNRTKGFAIITFTSCKAAQDAINKMNKTKLCGNITLKVEEKRRKKSSFCQPHSEPNSSQHEPSTNQGHHGDLATDQDSPKHKHKQTGDNKRYHQYKRYHQRYYNQNHNVPEGSADSMFEDYHFESSETAVEVSVKSADEQKSVGILNKPELFGNMAVIKETHHNQRQVSASIQHSMPVSEEIRLAPDQWDRFVCVDKCRKNVLQDIILQLKDSLDVLITPSSDTKIITLSGAHNAVMSAKQLIESALAKELIVDKMKLRALLLLFPGLPEKLSDQLGVKLIGYEVDSNCVQFEGILESVMQARKMFEHHLQQVVIDSIKLPSVELIPSAKKRLMEEGVQVVVYQRLPSETKLELFACDKVEMYKAVRILGQKPFENFVTSSSESSDLATLLQRLQHSYQVYFSCQRQRIIISGYILKDVQQARHDLEQKTIKVPSVLHCTPEHHQYLSMVLVKNPTYATKAFLSSLPATVSFERGQIVLFGNKDAIKQSEEMILRDKIPPSLQHRSFSFNCDLIFLQQIKQLVLDPLKYQFDFTYSCERCKKANCTFLVHIFSIQENFRKICADLETLLPCTKQYPLDKASFVYIQDMIEAVEDKYRVRVILSENCEVLKIHALTEQEANECWKEIEHTVNSKLVIWKTIKVTPMQVKYLQSLHARDLCIIKSEALQFSISLSDHENNTMLIRINGTINQVSVTEAKLKELIENEYCEVIFGVQISKDHLEMWQRRWHQVKTLKEKSHDIIINFVPHNCTPPAVNLLMVDFTLCGHDWKVIKDLKEMIVKEESGNCIKTRKVKLPLQGAETLASKRKDLDIRTLNVVLDINKVTNTVTITAPEKTSGDLTVAENVILEFLDRHILKTDFVISSNPHLGRMLSLEQGKQRLRELDSSISKYVTIAVLEPPQNGVSVTGTTFAIEAVKPAVEDLFKELLQYIEWMWANDNGSFSPYSDKDCKILTHYYKENPKKLFMHTIGNQTYFIDFNTMIQTNVLTEHKRKIRRGILETDVGLEDFMDVVPSTPLVTQGREGRAPSNPLVTQGRESRAPSNPLVTQGREGRAPSNPLVTQGREGHAPSNPLVTQGREGRASTLWHRLKEWAKDTVIQAVDTSSLRETVSLPVPECGSLEARLVTIIQQRGLKYSLQEYTSQVGICRELILEGQRSLVLRTISDIQKEIILSEASLPVEWEPQSSTANEVPREWKPQSTTVQLFSLASKSPEWNHVVQIFQKTLPHAAIHSVQRIQNKWLWDRYIQHKKRLHTKNNGAVNEKELFHGTRNNDPKLIYDSEEGFDMRYSDQGMWGMANYFAVNASYSDSYAHHDPSTGLKEMFLVKVLTGDSYNCAPDSSLRMPPTKSTGAGGQVQVAQLKYDTVTGVTKGSQVFMAYDNEKAYPAYLICYK